MKEATKVATEFFTVDTPEDLGKVQAIAEHVTHKGLAKSDQAADVMIRALIRDARREAMSDKHRRVPVLDRVFRRVRMGVLAK